MKKGPIIALLAVVVIVLGLVVVVGMIYLNLTEEPTVSDQTYLQVEISGAVNDAASVGLAGIFSDALTIQDLWYQIERAAIDPRIKGLVLKIRAVDAGFGKMREIGLMIKNFRGHKKPVIAFIESGGLKECYLASFADKVILFQSGIFHFVGPAAEAMFLKNTFSKLGIEADMLHVGQYKTSYNMYTEDHMTPPHREAVRGLLDDIFTSVVREIAVNRRLDEKKVRSLLDESPLEGEAYVKSGLADRMGYFDDVFQELKFTYSLTPLRTYMKNTSALPFIGQKKIAVIFASGEIVSGKSGGQFIGGDEAMGADTIAEYLRNARNQYSVKAVVLRVDSPGGSGIASDVILREAQLLAKKKPLVISMSDMAASGGYWISMAASRIYAHPQTITGSIGVLAGKFVLKGFYDKIGISKELVKTTKYSGIFSDYAPFSSEERAKLIAGMETFYRGFIQRVAENRKLEIAAVERIAQGRVWSGEAALKLKLVDQFGGLDDAVQEAKKLARIATSESIGLRIYPKKKGLLELLFSRSVDMQAKILVPNAQEILRQLKGYFPAFALPYRLNIL